MARNSVAYDEDFYAWTVEQARLLRSGELSLLDVENIAEELENMGRSDKRELDSRLEVLLVHLLKWQVQVQFRSRSWSGTIREQRSRIEDPRPQLSRIQPSLYARARRVASNETGLPASMFPASCPFTAEQVMTEDFVPD